MVSALFGGLLIGAAASILWLGSGRIAGVSGMVAGALRPPDGRRVEQLLFLLGLVLAGVAAHQLRGAAAAVPSSAPVPAVLLAGLLVGFGARLGSGCTSGHGVCGLSRFSLRSLVAVLTFMTTGAVTVFVVTHFFPTLRVAP